MTTTRYPTPTNVYPRTIITIRELNRAYWMENGNLMVAPLEDNEPTPVWAETTIVPRSANRFSYYDDPEDVAAYEALRTINTLLSTTA